MTAPGPPSLRALDSGDRLLLRVATWMNLNWREQRVTFAQLDDDARLAAYYRSVPEVGFVSMIGSEPTGVVWVTLFPPDAPGFGFVHADVPELSVCVLPGYRGAGIGAVLLDAAVTEARRRSLAGLSLSVEAGNPARRLYESRGFAPPAAPADVGTLVLELRGGPRWP